MLAGGAWLFLASIVDGEWSQVNLGAVTAKSWIAFGYLTLFGSLVAFTAFAWLLRVTTPSKVSTAGYVNPIVAVFLGWAIAAVYLAWTDVGRPCGDPHAGFCGHLPARVCAE